MAELIIEEPRLRCGQIELAAEFRSGGARQRLWYRVEDAAESSLGTNADPFVRAFVHLAMTAGESVRVRGTVSPSLLRNLAEFQMAWSAWVPRRYTPVRFSADSEIEQEDGKRDEAISGFSGGVDSCFTAFRHSKNADTEFQHRLTSVVMVQGFDIPLEDREGFESARTKVKRQLDSLGLGLLSVETNFREQPVHWPHAFGAGLASVMSLFQGRYRYGLIAQGVPYRAYKTIVEGSNPLTDPLLSSDPFTVVPDAPGYTRIDKIEILQSWPEGLKDLRVCWRNPIRDENCCVCEKCIRNILSFRVLGLGLPDCFAKDVNESQIMDLVPIKPFKIDIGYGPILKRATEEHLDAEAWVQTLREAVRLSRRYELLRRVRGGRVLWRLGRRLGVAGLR